MTDATIRAYCASLRYESDILLGIEDPRGDVVGLAHGCVYEAGGQRRVEGAFSVDREFRGRGLGSRLMAMLEVRARASGAQALVGMCAVRNLPMRRIFERAGLVLRREDDELHGQRELLAADRRAAHCAWT
nr:GNAT family N-acetyltransferase [Piscinibacter sp. XHJ-5]